MNARAPGGTTWAGWYQTGGILHSSAPVATVFPSSPETRAVFALGADDGNLWRGQNPVGGTTWIWTQIP